ncbi:MAG: tetratricopeptide repeat protein [Betaproteobacteria bacterium]|nr:tetratricopeptide repeat protein [Betaproteobacteria bacterium]
MRKRQFTLIATLALTCLIAFAGEAEWKAHTDAGGAAFRRGDYRTAIVQIRNALEEAEAFGERDPRLAASLGDLGRLYERQGRYSEAEPLVRRALRLIENALGPGHEAVANELTSLAGICWVQRRYAEAEKLYQRSLQIREKALGPDHPDVGTTLNNLALLYHVQGRYAEAEPLYRRTLLIREKVLGPNHPSVANGLDSIAVIYWLEGRYADAEPLYRRSLLIREKALGPDHQDVGKALNNLAGVHRDRGLYATAESLYRRSLQIRERALGSDHPDVGTTLNDLGILYFHQKHYGEAEALLRRSLQIREKVLDPDHSNVGDTLNNLGALYRAQGRYAEAEPLLRRSLQIREKALGAEHPNVGQSLNNLAPLYQAQGLGAEAESLYRRSLSIYEKALGPDHTDVGTTLVNLAYLYNQQKRFDEGLGFARRATKLLAGRFTERDETGGSALLAEQRTRSANFDLHVALLYGARPAEAGAEGFEVAQLARASDTADQVARMAARYATGSDALAQLARARQDAIARLRNLDSRIVQAASRPPKDRNADAEARLRAEAEEAKGALTLLDARIEREFPQYQELTSPKPLALAEAQKLLAESEALVGFLIARDESYVWALKRGVAAFERLALSRKELEAEVTKLRAQLDLKAGVQILEKPFDVAAAHALYRKLFSPIEGVIVGAKDLLIVPDGALTSLPPGVLVTQLPQRPIEHPADHAGVAWLAKKYAITVLPSVSSLRALRAFARGSPGSEPFSGFGNPLLQGSPSDQRGRKVAALFARGAVADVAELRKAYEPLPETADELRAIAATLKAPASALYLGRDATETKVKSVDLSRYRNLAFATHGVMAGEFKGVAEPGLVLTPPEAGTELDDGLLTASEIAQLKLNADWVILSACNTAAADGTPGAEGFSGLAKAFFYAGARSLLVSHWSVGSEAAEFLTTRMFEESARGASKAQALQRSTLALMQRTDKPHFAHPAFWAPFVVVGEGNSGWATTSAPPPIPPSQPAARQAPEVRSPSAPADDPVGKTVEDVKSFFERLLKPAPAQKGGSQQ